jgi:hypothetical protein
MLKRKKNLIFPYIYIYIWVWLYTLRKISSMRLIMKSLWNGFKIWKLEENNYNVNVIILKVFLN